MIHDPITTRARKFLAIIDPSANAAPAEQEAARRALAALLSAHGLTLADIDPASRATFRLPVPTKEDANLANQLCAQITDNRAHQGKILARHEPPKPGRKRWRLLYEYECELTASEANDVRAAYRHYAPELAATRKRLAEATRQAKRAQAMAVSGFINKHGIFPASATAGASAPLSAAKMRALIDALNASTGAAWQKPAPQLTA